MEFTIGNTDQQKHQEMLMVIERPQHISFLSSGSVRNGKTGLIESTTSGQNVVVELWDRDCHWRAEIAPRKERGFEFSVVV